MAGAMRKPALSWSWFLETDDSEIQKFAFKYGFNDEELELSSIFLKEMIEKWLDFWFYYLKIYKSAKLKICLSRFLPFWTNNCK